MQQISGGIDNLQRVYVMYIYTRLNNRICHQLMDVAKWDCDISSADLDLDLAQIIGKSTTRYLQRFYSVSASVKLSRHVDTLVTKYLPLCRYYWWTKFMHVCAHIDILYIQQGCNSCRHI